MCLSPLNLRVPDGTGYHYITVPCGSCDICLHNKQNRIMTRIFYELFKVQKACFLTLTFSDNKIPKVVTEDGSCHYTLQKSVFQKWMKRLRINIWREKGIRVRNFYCGEYGSKTFRPHYHVILFGVDVNDVRRAIVDWRMKYGIVDYTNFGDTSKFRKKQNYNVVELRKFLARYLSKYASKGVYGTWKDRRELTQTALNSSLDWDSVSLGEPVKPYMRGSNRLGLDYFMEKVAPTIMRLDEPIRFKSLAELGDFISGLRIYDIPLPNGVAVPSDWKKILFGITDYSEGKDANNNKLHIYGNKFKNFILKAIGDIPEVQDIMYEYDSKTKDFVFSFHRLGDLYTEALRLSHDRRLVELLREYQPSLCEDFSNMDVVAYRSYLEKERSRVESVADSIKRSLLQTYSQEFC